MKKAKGKGKGKNNVLNKLAKAVNNKANSVFHKKKTDQVEVQNPNKNLQSTLEGSNIGEYCDLVRLSQKTYEIINEQTALQIVKSNVIISQNQVTNVLLNNILKNSHICTEESKSLTIPKRPKWKEGISKAQFEQMEKEAFLAWRKGLAEEEERNMKYSITPFEKNIEVWRQLWLVVEKCDVLVQIVDGRNPLYFRCPDLEKYIKDVDSRKEYILLINKADLMTKEVRKSWADYFQTIKMNYVFFSALEESIESDDEEEEEEENEEVVENKREIDESETINKLETVNIRADDPSRILQRNELIGYLKSFCVNKPQPYSCHYIGFIGFPNVGKSSVINILMQTKKVAVAMIPGKTKHYQTLFLPNDKKLCLMDCPGLVFPSFKSSKADMLVNGILPIDTVRDYHSAIALIIKRIPKKIIEKFFKIELPDIYSAKQFLQMLATSRGYFTGSSLPDEAKTAKWVLKEYVSGKLLYCYLRPDYDEDKFGEIIPYEQLWSSHDCEQMKMTQDEKENHKILEEIPPDFDDNIEKIMTNPEILENKKVPGEGSEIDFDNQFFDELKVQEQIQTEMKEKPISKEMKRNLKFAEKRGEITEEEYEMAMTCEDYEVLMKKIQSEKKSSGIGKDLVNLKKINF